MLDFFKKIHLYALLHLIHYLVYTRYFTRIHKTSIVRDRSYLTLRKNITLQKYFPFLCVCVCMYACICVCVYVCLCISY